MVAAFETGMLVARPAWHGLGKVLSSSPKTAAEAMIAAGMDWTVRKEPLFKQDAKTGKMTPVRAVAVVRESDGKVLADHIGPNFEPLQNKEAFTFFDPFVESGEVNYETAGSLFDGKKVWVLAKLNRDPIEVAKGDEVEKYLLLSNSHDGTLAVRVGFSPIRVVCWNTLCMAHGNSKSPFVRLRHTARVKEALAVVRETVDAANEKFEATAEQYRELLRHDFNRADLEKFVKVVFKPNLISKDPEGKEEAYFKRLIGEMEVVDAKELPHVQGTYWSLYNAATNYLTHSYGRSQDTRLNGLWFGEGARINQRALETAMDMAT